ncbi:hypothetical protein EYZ11_013406 [Aspergillus tanneri]|uniref:Uncharacterized protein n=1 Tax=Aspergillus tanneri TaxID=1220188 RepID=A0A4S3IZV0_9EURO|nr:hypothetical protein EYZ11_013406 [Aspergillus tanneri]
MLYGDILTEEYQNHATEWLRWFHLPATNHLAKSMCNVDRNPPEDCEHGTVGEKKTEQEGGNGC